MKRYTSQPRLLTGLQDHWPVKRLRWFTRGFYAVQNLQDSVVIADLRMGAEPHYVFRFQVGLIGNPHPEPTPSRRIPNELRLKQLEQVWQRIWSPSPQVPQAG
jgi:inner membrane protein